MSLKRSLFKQQHRKGTWLSKFVRIVQLFQTLPVTKRKTSRKDVLQPVLYRCHTHISKNIEARSFCLECEIHLEWQSCVLLRHYREGGVTVAKG